MIVNHDNTHQGAAHAAAAQHAGSSVAGSKSGHNSGGKAGAKLHEERWKVAAEAASNYEKAGSSAGSRTLTELKLETPIRYSSGDPIEKWLNSLLCLDIVTNSTRIVSSIPAPKDCELYHGKLLLICICNFHVLSHLLIVYICKLHWNSG